jgi:hypothetical protein
MFEANDTYKYYEKYVTSVPVIYCRNIALKIIRKELLRQKKKTFVQIVIFYYYYTIELFLK